MTGIKDQFFGVEAEMTGITREEAAQAIADYFGTNAYHQGGCYDTYAVQDQAGKTWKIMRDASITTEMKIGNLRRYTHTRESAYSVEMVTPKLEYSEMEKLQEAVRRVRKAGAKVNASCGIHIHVDGANHTAKSLRNILGIMYAKEDILFKSLQVRDDRVGYCKKTREHVLMKARAAKNLTMESLYAIWYGDNDSYHATHHYDDTRYHALNLHAMFSKGTVEFRCFNSTLHAGEVKAYVNLALAISAQAIRQKSTQITKTTSDNEKFTFRTWLLRLGMVGDEFKTTRDHLLKHLDGNAAWRYAPSHYPTHPATVASNRNNETASVA